LSTINQEDQQDETLRGIHYLISKTILFGGLSFGVWCQGTALESGDEPPHSKKQRF